MPMVMVNGCGTAMHPGNRNLRSQLGLTSEVTKPRWTEGTGFPCAFSGADDTMRRHFS